MFTMPNLLTLARIPLAWVFFDGTPMYRGAAVLLAALTDFLDGYWARRFRASSHLGKFIDPLVDKFFVICCATALVRERALDEFQILTLMMRDLALVAFMVYAACSGMWNRCSVQSLWSGKIFTALQFAVLLGFPLFGTVPHAAFWPFAALGPIFFFELRSQVVIEKYRGVFEAKRRKTRPLIAKQLPKMKEHQLRCLAQLNRAMKIETSRSMGLQNRHS